MPEPTYVDDAAQSPTVVTLRHVFTELRSIADDPVPAVRGPVRLALGDIAQALNALGSDYLLYSTELTP